MGTRKRRARPQRTDRVQKLVGVDPIITNEIGGSSHAYHVQDVATNVVELLKALGFSEDPGLRDTPTRVAKALLEYTSGYRQKLKDVLKTTFPGEGYGKCDEMIIVKGIPFYSLCEHHLAPFHGTAAVAYIPRNQILGLSKMARLVDFFARRLQVQERLTEQVADTLMKHLKPRGVGVLIEAEHLCMAMRGVQKPGTSTVTSALKGCFREAAARQEFLTLVRGK